MKIILVNDYGYKIGGAEEYLFSVAQTLKALGHEVLVVSSNRERGNFQFQSDYQLSASGNVFNLDSIFNISAFLTLRKILKEINPDVVHFQNIFYALSPAVIYAASNFKTILTLHDYEAICLMDKRLQSGEICRNSRKTCPNCGCKKQNLRQKLRRVLMQSALSKVNTLVAPSKFLCEEFKKNSFNNCLHLSHPKLWSPSAKEPELRADHKKYFLYIGRLTEQKGLRLLIDAFLEATQDSSIALKIAGTGSEQEALQSYVNAKGAEDKIKFLGFIAGDEKTSLLANALANILPSLWPEVSPISIAEAASYGVPNIVSSAGGMPEIVEHLKTGLVFDVGDKADLIQKLRFAITNQETMRELGINAKNLASSYTIKHHANDLLSLYQQA